MENSQGYNILTVGVGGQGVIFSCKLLAAAALEDGGNQVRTAETHGMAQRGGTVIGYLRFGPKVSGPLIHKADVMLSFELSEALRSIKYADSHTSLFVSTDVIIPPSVYTYKIPYPEQEKTLKYLNKVTKNVHLINAREMAVKAGNSKTLNVILIGAMFGAGKLPIKEESLKNAIIKFVPAKAKEVNDVAFKMGYEIGQKIKEEFYE
ncbi:MAG: pyruvate ferredoxin oxidoreductase [Promethearchaeota archaeon]|nr:MAG: pyruvate ferredoxin oxidoreductase [Candidatus Lokiarchaeota archaeon]